MQPDSHYVLAGKYRLVSPLRSGGMGSVWIAEHLSLNCSVAIKLLDPELASTPEAVARFMREARAAAQLRSPHIVQIIDVGTDDGVPFIAMELLEGETLSERLERVGKLAPAETARLITQVARGVTRAHASGVIHRDLKPSNIFIVRNDDEEIAKVVDFGIAKALKPGFDVDSGATRTGALVGSPHYMSPEQAEGMRVDHRTDVWSLGIVAFECLTGFRPFSEQSLGSQLLAICARPMPIPSRFADVPTGFDSWFARTCARPVEQRFGTVQEAAQQLRELCAASARPSWTARPLELGKSGLSSVRRVLGVSARPSGPADSARHPLWRVSLWVVGAALLAALATVAAQKLFVTQPVAAPAKTHEAVPTIELRPEQPARPAAVQPIPAAQDVVKAAPLAPSTTATTEAKPSEPSVVPARKALTAPKRPAATRRPAPENDEPWEPAPSNSVNDFKSDPY